MPSKPNEPKRLRRDEIGFVIFPEEDNEPVCKTFGCRNKLSLGEQLFGYTCNSCQQGDFRTIKAICPDYKVKPKESIKPVLFAEFKPKKEEKGKRYGSLGFGSSYSKFTVSMKSNKFR